jgi:serine/threonine protein kinase
VDLECGLKAGEKVRVEEYLQRYPELLRDADLVVELAYAEYALRRRCGEPELAIDEYLQRFPQYRAQLIERLAREEPPRPQQIGRYRVERLLGEGGFGRVYLAVDDQLQRHVAIKVPHAKLVSRAEDAEAYLVEARTLASLDHPHIVPVYDVGSTEEHPCYIVSKYVEGTDLAARIKHDRPSHVEAAELAANVAEALHYAHKRGLVHRNVKPGNILIDAQGKPFVADFGVALRDQDIGRGPRYAAAANLLPRDAQLATGWASSSGRQR